MANIEESHEQMSAEAVPILCEVFFDEQFMKGKELMLNIARLLSRVSLDMSCAAMMVKSNRMGDFL